MVQSSGAYDPEPTIILVGQDLGGRYCVCENHGMIGGAFASRAEAIRFARAEGRSIPRSIVMVTPLVIHTSATDASPGDRLTALAA